MKYQLTVLALAAAFTAASAQSAVVSGLYNTGVGVGGAALAAGDGQQDGNYKVGSSNLSGIVAGAPTYTYYNGAYAAENASSRWIAYSGSPFVGVGSFSASTTFDLTGYQPGTASITGNWGVDNEGEIFLNGVSTGITLTGIVVGNFNVLHSFTIGSGFVAGINTLTFAVYDGGSPAAVRLDNAVLTATATVTAVPDAATWTLMIAGFGMVGATLRRRAVATA